MSGKAAKQPAKKSGGKSAPKRPRKPKAGELVPGPRGGKLRHGSKKGNTPGTGRPPDEFKQRMRELTTRKDVETYLERCLKGEFGPKFFLSAWREMRDSGYGKPVQAHEVSGADGAPIEVAVTHRIVDASAD